MTLNDIATIISILIAGAGLLLTVVWRLHDKTAKFSVEWDLSTQNTDEEVYQSPQLSYVVITNNSPKIHCVNISWDSSYLSAETVTKTSTHTFMPYSQYKIPVQINKIHIIEKMGVENNISKGNIENMEITLSVDKKVFHLRAKELLTRINLDVNKL